MSKTILNSSVISHCTWSLCVWCVFFRMNAHMSGDMCLYLHTHTHACMHVCVCVFVNRDVFCLIQHVFRQGFLLEGLSCVGLYSFLCGCRRLCVCVCVCVCVNVCAWYSHRTEFNSRVESAEKSTSKEASSVLTSTICSFLNQTLWFNELPVQKAGCLLLWLLRRILPCLLQYLTHHISTVLMRKI